MKDDFVLFYFGYFPTISKRNSYVHNQKSCLLKISFFNFIYLNENRTMKPVEIVLKREEWDKGE
jgi:hypothetical protein